MTLGFTQRGTGRKAHGTCAARSKQNRRRSRCIRTIIAGTLTFTGHPGANTVRFGGRISRTHKLKLGRYTVRITATNAHGQRSAPQSLTFTIVK